MGLLPIRPAEYDQLVVNLRTIISQQQRWSEYQSPLLFKRAAYEVDGGSAPRVHVRNCGALALRRVSGGPGAARGLLNELHLAVSVGEKSLRINNGLCDNRQVEIDTELSIFSKKQ